jgi:peptide/nickel transport system permease protein
VFARLTRGAALPIWTRGYVMSAATAGKNRLQISLEHILPNVAPVLIVQATVQFSLAVLAEAALSYVGLGAQPPNPSWGRMLAESQTMVSFAPWLAIFPGLAIFLFVFGLNLLGDGLRRRFDPHRKTGPM